MDVVSKILFLIIIAIIYGIILIGVKEYHMRDILKSWTKKEKLGTLVGIAILLLGIMMKISKTPLTVGNGIVSKSVYMITDTIFAGNATVISLIIAMCFFVPAIILQVLFAQKVTEMLNIPYCNPFFYILIFAFQAGIYNCWLEQTPDEAVLILIFSALLYFGICTLDKIRSKKIYAYILLYLVLWIIIFVVEENKVWSIYFISIISIFETIIFAWFRGKTIIFRKGIRMLGAFLLFMAITYVNYCLF